MSIKHYIYLTSIILFLSTQLRPQGKDIPQLPQTKHGEIVAAYLEAFNSGDTEIMRKFFMDYSSIESLKKFPVDQRVIRYKQMYEYRGKLELLKNILSDKNNISILVKDKERAVLRFDFVFEPSPSFKIESIRILNQGKGYNPAESKKDNKELIEAVKNYMYKLSESDMFSGAVLVAQNNKILFQNAYGYSDRDKRIPNDIDTKFNVGSIDKIFTRIAIEQLQSEGKLSFEDTLKKYLPDYPNKEAAEKVTINNLLNMSSGIGDFFGDRFNPVSAKKIKSILDYFPLFVDKPLEFEPGTQNKYSNGGYIVLGAIIQKVTGENYYNYVNDKIFKPAGMLNSGFFEKDSLPNNCAKGYTVKDSKLVVNYSFLPGIGSSAGGGYSTTQDLFNFIGALKDKKITSSGFSLNEPLNFAGGTAGVNANLVWIPEKDYLIVVLSNLDPPAAEKVGSQISSWLPE